jgi:hypothetical protein
MDGITGLGGVPAWLEEPLGGQETPNKAEQRLISKRFGEQVPVRQDEPSTAKVLWGESRDQDDR